MNALARCIALLLFSAPLLAAGDFVELRGFVPRGVSEGLVAYEYKRIYTLLAPRRGVDRSPLVVTYFTRKGTAHEHYSLPEWGGGGAIGTDHIVVVVDVTPLLEQDPVQTTVHELAHIVISRVAGEMHVPRWFHEGVAMMVSRDVSFQEHTVISRAIFSGALMSLASIDSVNRFGPFRARLAYAQSRQAVQFLVETYGVESLAMIMREGRKSGSFWRGVHEVLGISPRELERLVHRFITQRYGPVFWLADTYVLWLGILALAVLAFVVATVRKRRRAAAMEEEETLEAAQAEEGHDTPHAPGGPPAADGR